MIKDSLHELGFRQLIDNRWYPAEIEDSLVRVQVTTSEYRIERRTGDSWIMVVEAIVSDFDPRAFKRWASSWDLTKS